LIGSEVVEEEVVEGEEGGPRLPSLLAHPLAAATGMEQGVQNLMEACLFGVRHQVKLPIQIKKKRPTTLLNRQSWVKETYNNRHLVMHHQVKLLVATRLIDVNQIDKSTGRTPLSLAAAVGSTSCVQILLSAGARPALRDVDGSIMLHSACKWGHGAVVYYTSEFLKFAQFRAFQAASATPDGAAAGGQEEGGGFVDLICMQDKYGWVLLKVAARRMYSYVYVCMYVIRICTCN
jgi:hypothetical protein